MRIRKSATIAGAVLAATIAGAQAQTGPTGQQGDRPAGETSAGSILEELRRAYAERQQQQAEREIVFEPRSSKDMAALGMRDVYADINKLPGAAEKTTLFVALADVATTPGPETIAIVKGPATCGRVGCMLVVYGEVGGVQTKLLETLGETIESPRQNRIVVNRGSKFEVVWRYRNGKFEKRRW